MGGVLAERKALGIASDFGHGRRGLKENDGLRLALARTSKNKGRK